MKEKLLFVCKKRPWLEEIKNKLLEKYEIINSDNYKEALELYDKFKPSLILIEDIIKGQSGIELSKQLKQGAHNLIIVLFIHTEVIDEKKAKIMSAADYVIKYPSSIEDLKELYEIDIIRSILSKGDAYEGKREKFQSQLVKEEEKPFLNLGEYRLIKKIAEGGMADIYLAAKTGISGFRKLVVLKVINSFFSRSEDFIKRFMDEAKIGAHLNHKNIIQIYDHGIYEGQLFIAMEYVKGLNLDELMKAIEPEKIPEPIAVYIMQEICYGLSYAFNATDDKDRNLNIIHRDLSPHNVLISFNGEVKIADFGVAKASISHRLTEKKALVGKLSYMSPEQINGICYHSSDIFALGIIFYQMISGKHPFITEENYFSPTEIIQSICKGQYMPLEKKSKKIEEIEPIIYKMLDKDINTRYDTALNLLNDLLKISWASNQKELKEFINNIGIGDRENKQ